MADDDYDKTLAQDQEGDTDLIKALRSALRKHEKGAGKVPERLEAAKEEGRTEAQVAFERQAKAFEVAPQGLAKGVVSRWLKDNQETEPTADGLKAYAESEFGIKVAETESQNGQSSPQPQPQQQPPAAFTPGGPQGEPAGQKRWTGPELNKAFRAGEINAQEVQSAHAEGRVTYHPDPGVIYH